MYVRAIEEEVHAFFFLVFFFQVKGKYKGAERGKKKEEEEEEETTMKDIHD